jgi:hypothetical protein
LLIAERGAESSKNRCSKSLFYLFPKKTKAEITVLSVQRRYLSHFLHFKAHFAHQNRLLKRLDLKGSLQRLRSISLDYKVTQVL